jgi:hypothetical protein
MSEIGHEPDIGRCLLSGRDWGDSGHRAEIWNRASLTHRVVFRFGPAAPGPWAGSATARHSCIDGSSLTLPPTLLARADEVIE